MWVLVISQYVKKKWIQTDFQAEIKQEHALGLFQNMKMYKQVNMHFGASISLSSTPPNPYPVCLDQTNHINRHA